MFHTLPAEPQAPPGFAYFQHHHELPDELLHALPELAIAHGTSYDSYLATAPERESLWLADGAGFVAFVRRGRYVNVVGSLIAPPAQREALARGLARFAALNGLTVSVLNVEAADVPVFRRLGYEVTNFAQDYVVDLTADISSGKRYRDLRQRLHSIGDKGYTFAQVAPDDRSPARWRELVEELTALERENLGRKIQKKPTEVFQGRLTADNLGRRRLFVAFAADGRADAFLLLNPYRAGAELGLETYRYRVGTSAYVLRALIYHVMLRLKEEGAAKMSLGIVPGLNLPRPDGGESRLTRGLLAFWVKHLGFVANIEGVYHFKQRFRPRAEARYSCVTPRATVGSIYAFLRVWGGLDLDTGRFCLGLARELMKKALAARARAVPRALPAARQG